MRIRKLGLALAGCETVAAGAEGDSANAPASVETAADGGPSRLTLTEEALQRLRLQTAPVTGQPGDLSIPHAAVVYDADGASWAFIELEPRVYQRAPIVIRSIDGDRARLSSGPGPGTNVVTVATAAMPALPPISSSAA